MGNSLGVVLDNYIGSAPFPCHLQLGPSTSIDLSRDLYPLEGGPVLEIVCVTYKIDEKRCMVHLVRHNVDRYGNVDRVDFNIWDPLSGKTNITIGMQITDTNYVSINRHGSTFTNSTLWTKTNRSFDAWGGVIDTTVDFYGSAGTWGLLAVESKKNNTEEEAEVVTVAHYFVKSSGTSFYGSTGTIKV